MKLDNILVIKADEMALMKLSNTLLDQEIYGNLAECIKPYKKLSKRELDEDSSFDSKARTAILSQAKKNMMEDIKAEWHGAKYCDVTDEEIHCELCNRKNKYIFYIVNNQNGNELHVGSECIKKFKNIENCSKLKRDLESEKKIKKKRAREVEFDNMEAPDYDYGKTMRKKFDSLSLVLPFQLYENTNEYIKKILLIKRDYIEKGGDFEATTKRYYEAKEQLQKLWVQIEDFHQKNEHNILACNAKQGNWLAEKYPDIFVKIRENGGAYNEDTLRYVHEREFLTQNLHVFQDRLTDKDLKILQISEKAVVFVLQDNPLRKPLTFQIPSNMFMMKIGYQCILDFNYKYSKKDLSEYSILPSFDNAEALQERIQPIMENVGFSLVIMPDSHNIYYEKYFINDDEIKYKKISIETVLKLFSKYIFAEDEVLKKVCKVIHNRICKGNYGWISEDRKNELEEIASEAAAMQKQREFIHYT